MVGNVAMLLLGLVIAVFHRRIASVMMRQERVLDTYLRQRGILLPPVLSDHTAENLYFFVGIFICLAESARIWIGL